MKTTKTKKDKVNTSPRQSPHRTRIANILIGILVAIGILFLVAFLVLQQNKRKMDREAQQQRENVENIFLQLGDGEPISEERLEEVFDYLGTDGSVDTEADVLREDQVNDIFSTLQENN